MWHLAASQPERAEEVAARGEALLGEAHPERAGRFLNNAFMLHFSAGAWREAEAALERALRYYPASSRYRTISVSNLAIVRWHLAGDLLGALEARDAVVQENVRYRPTNVPGDYLHLAELRLFLGERAEALGLLHAARPFVDANPRWGLLGEVLRFNLEGRAEAFPDLLRRGRARQPLYSATKAATQQVRGAFTLRSSAPSCSSNQATVTALSPLCPPNLTKPPSASRGSTTGRRTTASPAPPRT